MEEETKSVVEDEAEVILDVDNSQDVTGNIKISVDVVATIAGIATEDIEGVAYMYSSFAGGIAEMLSSKKNPTKGVKVEMTDTNVTVDLYLVVDYGVRIPELAWEVQENVKSSIETMTGLTVDKVNIHIEGVSFEKQRTAEAQAKLEAQQAEEAPQVLEEAEGTKDEQ